MIRGTVVAGLVDGEQLPETGSATEQLRAYMAGYWQVVRAPEYAPIYRLIIGELHRFPDLVQFYVNEVVLRARKIIARIIERGIESGEFRELDPLVGARMMAALMSTNAMWCSKRKYFPQIQDTTDEQVFEELVDFYLHAIRA